MSVVRQNTTSCVVMMGSKQAPSYGSIRMPGEGKEPMFKVENSRELRDVGGS